MKSVGDNAPGEWVYWLNLRHEEKNKKKEKGPTSSLERRHGKGGCGRVFRNRGDLWGWLGDRGRTPRSCVGRPEGKGGTSKSLHRWLSGEKPEKGKGSTNRVRGR